jgi:hypothetical protein
VLTSDNISFARKKSFHLADGSAGRVSVAPHKVILQVPTITLAEPHLEHKMLMGENLKVVRAEFSPLS